MISSWAPSKTRTMAEKEPDVDTWTFSVSYHVVSGKKKQKQKKHFFSCLRKKFSCRQMENVNKKTVNHWPITL